MIQIITIAVTCVTILYMCYMHCARMIVGAHVVIRMPLVLVSLEVKVVRQTPYRM